MKLAEALIHRADLMKKISTIKERIRMNLLVQEGEKPSEDPKVLLRSFHASMDELTRLISAINHTNAITKFDEKRTLSDAIAERDSLLKKSNTYAAFASESVPSFDRYSTSEIKKIAVLDAKALNKESDRYSKMYRELDLKLQEKNWQTELSE